MCALGSFILRSTLKLPLLEDKTAAGPARGTLRLVGDQAWETPPCAPVLDGTAGVER